MLAQLTIEGSVQLSIAAAFVLAITGFFFGLYFKREVAEPERYVLFWVSLIIFCLSGLIMIAPKENNPLILYEVCGLFLSLGAMMTFFGAAICISPYEAR